MEVGDTMFKLAVSLVLKNPEFVWSRLIGNETWDGGNSLCTSKSGTIQYVIVTALFTSLSPSRRSCSYKDFGLPPKDVSSNVCQNDTPTGSASTRTQNKLENNITILKAEVKKGERKLTRYLRIYDAECLTSSLVN